tara:strand:+ start:737 stop:1126 length:390 start_codon:yes stop_codon:yes gene_type:complete
MGHWATEITEITARITATQATKTKLDELVTFFTNLPAGTTKDELNTALVNSTNRNDSSFATARDEELESYESWEPTQAEVDAHIAARLATFTTHQARVATELTACSDKKVLLEAKEAGTSDPVAEHRPL